MVKTTKVHVSLTQEAKDALLWLEENMGFRNRSHCVSESLIMARKTCERGRVRSAKGFSNLLKVLDSPRTTATKKGRGNGNGKGQ